MNIKHITLPLDINAVKNLHAGDTVELTGVIYTARDAAHKRFIELLDSGKPIPFDIENSVIYYCGPAPAKPSAIIGPCGPTTSYRMDSYTPRLLSCGLRGMIGKGDRSNEVLNSIVKHTAVYFGAIGGAGALLASCVKSAEIIAFADLGTEAVRRLTVEKFPVTVIADCYGKNLYVEGAKKWS
jgi:fumarate hydratase subunit beta